MTIHLGRMVKPYPTIIIYNNNVQWEENENGTMEYNAAIRKARQDLGLLRQQESHNKYKACTK